MKTFKITPDIATAILNEHNPYNRIISLNKVAQYKKFLKDKTFRIDGNSPPICFDWDGNLIDGQHRLLALQKANVDVSFTCIFGYDPTARYHFDQGKLRNTADIAVMAQLNFSNKFATAWVKGMFLGNKKEIKKNDLELIELARKYKDGLHFVCNIKRDYKVMLNSFKHAQIFKSPLVKAFYYEDEDRLLKFNECFESGKVKPGLNPAPFNLANAFIRASGGKTTHLRLWKQRRLWMANTEAAIYCFCNDADWEFESNFENINASLYPLLEFDGFEGRSLTEAKLVSA